MKHFRSLVAILAICVGGFAAAQAQQQIQSDYDRQTNFSQYKTYSWQQVNAPDSTWESRIQGDVDAQLSAKGWTRVDHGGDAVLCATATNGEAAAMEHFYGGGGPGWRWRGWNAPVSFDQGTVLIDIFDGKTQALIWRGFAAESMSSKDEKDVGKIDKVAEKLFKKFPPKD